MPLPGRSLPGPRSTLARLRMLLTPSTRLAPAVALVLAVVFLIVEGVLVFLIKQVDPRAPIGILYAALMGIALVANFWAGVAAVNAAAADRRREAELAADLAHLMLRVGDLRAAADVAAKELSAALGLRFARVELGGNRAADQRRGEIPLRDGEEVVGVLAVPDDLPRRTRQQLLRVLPTFEALLAAARERENIDNRLTESLQTIERFFELSSDLMVISDQGKLLRVNPAFERTLGYTVDELAPAPFDLVPVEDRDRLREPIRQLFDDGAPFRFENRATGRDGSPRWIDWSVAPYQGLFYAVGRDVTEQRREQEELRRTQTMLEASRDALVGLAEQQAGLRRIATLVAQGVSPDEVFRAVAEEMGRCLRVAGAAVSCFGDEGLVLLALAPAPSDFEQEVPLRARCPLDGDNVATRVFGTGRPARMDSDEDATGVFGDVCREMGVRCVVGVPIVVGDRVWGMASAGTLGDEPLPTDTEERIADFTDLVGTAIASAAGREELQASRDTLGELAEHQAGLRRVATLVAQGAGPVEIFEAVYYEMARCVHATSAALCRYEGDATATVLAARHDPGMQAPTVGTAVTVDDDRILAAVCSSGQPAREDGPEPGAGTALGVPVVVDGRVWGAISAASPGPEPLPSDTETRIADFADLVATAVANTAAREQLDASRDRLRQLARQQTGLRRVAELIAREADPADVFNAVAEEMADSLDVVNAMVLRYEGDEFAVEAVASLESDMPNKPVVGERFRMDGTQVVRTVRSTGRPARLDNMEEATGPAADHVRELGVESVVGVPIVVGGQLWGAAVVGSPTGPLPSDTEARVANFADLASTAIANAATRAQLQASRDDLRQLARQQTALRRVAELVAREAEPAEVFNAVAEEMAGCLDAYNATVARFDDDDIVIVALGRPDIDLPNPPVLGERYPLDGNHTAVMVKRTGRAARLDSHQDATGVGAARIREIGIQSMVAVPITVGRDMWGVAAVASRTGPLPADTEARIADFADLVATAIANAATRDQLQNSRDTLRDLARQQTALRRVAELVAREAEPRQVFQAVAEETAGCLDIYNASVGRFDDDDIVIEALGRAEPELPNPPLIGERFPLTGDHIGPVIRRTGRPFRMDSHDHAEGTSAARIRDIGVRCMVGVPITVGGHVWGVLAAASRNEPLPPDVEARMADFADLVGTSLANAATRAELQASRDNLSQLARQQTALRRVAELVAREAEPAEVFNAVAEQLGVCLDVYNTTVIRFDGDSLVVEAVGRAEDLTTAPAVGQRFSLDGDHVAPMVHRTGRAARIDSHEGAAGPTAAFIRELGIESMVAVPVVVGAHVWGAVGVASTTGVLPPDTEVRMADFADLVGTSIANAATRSELQASRDSLSELADNLSVLARQQTALRRVATLVAQGMSQSEVFSAVAEEMADCLNVGSAEVFRYEEEGAAIVVVASHAMPGVPHLEVGERLSTEGDNVSAMVLRTRRAARMDDWEGAAGNIADRVRELGLRSRVGAPIVVDERVWGIAVAGTTERAPLPPDTEGRIAEFADLVATAIAAATTRAELIASRARIVAAADDARRRLERDIHDGAQQRIVSLGLKLRLAEESISPESDALKHELSEAVSGLTDVFTELQEISRGIHPAILSTGGLSAAFKTLARRSSVPVNLDLGIGRRLPESVEVAAYYVVAEALTNAAKHAQASSVMVRAHTTEESLHLLISDDGIGGADSAKGSGLIGLKDRIEVLGGRMRVASPTGAGTRFDITIPYQTNGS
jgi:PAS domain S-box-containing protein